MSREHAQNMQKSTQNFFQEENSNSEEKSKIEREIRELRGVENEIQFYSR